jgi:large subunit ribosomal protein L17
MRHRKSKMKFNMSQGQRRSVLKNLAISVFTNKRIITTIRKAKLAKPLIENIITRAKKGTLHDIRMIESILNDQRLVMRIVREIAPHYSDRKGGYTRLVRYKQRVGDNAELCVFELIGDYSLVKKVDEDKPEKGNKAVKEEKKKKKAEKAKSEKKAKPVKTAKSEA